MNKIVEVLSEELKVSKVKIENTIKLIDEGNTIPFIARYRKEVTGNLDDEILRNLNERLNYLRNLEIRKDEVIRLISENAKLTDEIKNNILNATTLSEIEDIYRPFKPKKRTKATIAKEMGLEPLALQILKQGKSYIKIDDLVNQYINDKKGVDSFDIALKGAKDIIAEIISDDAYYRKKIRYLSFKSGVINTNAVNYEEKSLYEMYYNFSESINKIPSHRILAINRAEKEEKIKVKINVDEEKIISFLESKIIKSDNIFKSILKECIEDSYKRLIKPSIEREIRTELKEKADEKAIKVFGINAKQLLLQAPVKGKVVMGFDPAYRTGCKIAIIDETGKLLAYDTIYPTKPQNDIEGATKKLIELIEKYKVDIISIGNGTASRESEKFVSDVIKKINKKVFYTIVSEAGASVYSASLLATEEYPDINVSIRGAISIARRLQDPLAELVKIDPKAIGVGQYQHDVNQKRLDESLNGVVESAVNTVGVDINTATPSLLSYVSGINKSISLNIVKYRDEIGKFTNRKQILKVPKLGKATYVQCAGFLKIPESKNVLDNTMVHPESYLVAENLIKDLGYNISNITKQQYLDFVKKLDFLNIENEAKKLDVGIPTLEDIIKELKKPGRDPREEMPKVILKSDVVSIDDLKLDMILEGTVRNVTAFGVFVDIGIKNDGFVHISQISDKYVRDPMEEVSVADIVKVKIIKIDKENNKVSLSMRGLS